MSEAMAEVASLAQDLARLASAGVSAPATEHPAPLAASQIPATPLKAAPPRGFWANLVAVVAGGWKAAGCWVCVAVLAVNGIVIPLARIKYQHLEALDWRGVTLFAATLLGLRLFHMVENITGAGQ